MKKSFIFIALATATFVSCVNDETTAINQGNSIDFRTNMDGVTRAAAKTSFATNDVIDVFATFGGTKSFKEDFTKSDNGNFSSVNKHYWPSDISNTKQMVFTAFYGVAQSDETAGSLASAFTPSATAASQTDLLFAKHTSSARETPVLLNFRHMLSQINVKVKNSNSNISVDITGVRIGYIKTSGTFAYGVGDNTDTQNGSKIGQSAWTPTAFTAPAEGHTYANDYKYDQTVTTKTLNGLVSDAAALEGFSPWMLIPQNMTGSSTQYQNTKDGGTATDAPDLGGAYIALEMEIYNWNSTTRGDKIVAKQWCYWPITTNWDPGYVYNYTINVGGGGYMPTDKNNDKNLDPVLDTPIEFSVNCTIDAWSDYDSDNNTDGNQPIDVGN